MLAQTSTFSGLIHRIIRSVWCKRCVGEKKDSQNLLSKPNDYALTIIMYIIFQHIKANARQSWNTKRLSGYYSFFFSGRRLLSLITNNYVVYQVNFKWLLIWRCLSTNFLGSIMAYMSTLYTTTWLFSCTNWPTFFFLNDRDFYFLYTSQQGLCFRSSTMLCELKTWNIMWFQHSLL